ncbi:MAG: MarR family transcriptional regulator [Clostridium sp.]|nr:MarR family transcriptional regulator [Clostridium sp.]
MISIKPEKQIELILEDDFLSLLFYYICMTHEYLSKPYIKFLREEYDLNGHQMAAVGYLKQNKSMTMGELSLKVDISKQQTTQLVNSLVEKKFVTREVNPENRREVIVKPTEHAINILIEGTNYFLMNAMEQINEMFGDDKEKLEESLRYLSDVIPKMDFSMDNFSK